MKYDCYKTLDYAHEYNRFCNKHHCADCPLSYKVHGAGTCDALTADHIEILQRWSDEHPEKTRADKFLELLKGTEFEHAFVQLGEDLCFAGDNDTLWWNGVVEDD